jgi:hypothetical protein
VSARSLHPLLAAGLVLLPGGCSTARPWINQPIRPDSPAAP